MTRSVYLAYPIDRATRDDDMVAVLDIVTEARDLLLQHGVAFTYDPGDAFNVGRGLTLGEVVVGPEIRRINDGALAVCESLFAILPRGVPTYGVVAEVEAAVLDGKPVALGLPDGKATWSVPNGDNVHVFDYQDPPAVYGAVAWLAAQGGGGDAGAATGDALVGLPVLVGSGGRLPSRVHHDDGALDLYVSRDTVIPAGEFVDVPCGVSVALPDFTVGWITGRSSTLRRRRLLVATGIIDSGYRGELFAGVENLGEDDHQVVAGERIAQMLILPNLAAQFAPTAVQSLPDHARGVNGFGSTGS